MMRLRKYIALCIFCLLQIQFSFGLDAHKEKERQLALRKIGHEILLQFGDSTSRVLPIIKSEKEYRIEFETQLAINPRQLVETIDQVVLERGLAESYFVEVEECLSKDIAYLYKVEPQKEDFESMQCGSRDLPIACYRILLSLIEGEVNVVKLEPNDQNTSTSSIDLIYSLALLMAIVLGIGGGILFYKRKARNASEDHSNLIQLGKFQIDEINSQIILEEQQIELSGKELSLLLLLYQYLNHTIEKERILNVVWGDQGDYVGRSLDVYVSKLRKKLKADENLKIVNIRGVGYRLVCAN